MFLFKIELGNLCPQAEIQPHKIQTILDNIRLFP